ncbi:cytochrome P450 [Nannocystaceae bacterium ST9]
MNLDVNLPPGPRGSLLPSMQMIQKPIESFRKWGAQYGHTFTVKRLGVPTVVTAEPDLIGEIYSVRDIELYDQVVVPTADTLFGAHSLLLISGARHQRERKLMTPPFHGDRIRGWAQTMADAGRRAFAEGGEMRFGEQTKQATLEVIVRVVFGVGETARVEEFMHAIEAWTRMIRPGFLFYRALQHDYLGLAPYARYRRASDHINALLVDQIGRVRKGEGERSDVLSGLVDARYDDGSLMEDEIVRDHLRTLLFGGHETTATILTWVMYFVHRHPEVRERLLAELDTLGPDPDLEAMTRLPYLGAVIDETLRMRPVTTEISRQLRKPWKLGPWSLPSGSAVCPAVTLLHFRPDLWPDPERFSPERFLDKKPEPNTFIPWGGGTHRCLGAVFARFEAGVIIGTLLREFEFELLDEQVEWGRGRVALEALGGVRVRVRPKTRATTR